MCHIIPEKIPISTSVHKKYSNEVQAELQTDYTVDSHIIVRHSLLEKIIVMLLLSVPFIRKHLK